MGDRLHNLSFEDLKRLDAMVKGLLVEYPERAVIELPVGEGDQLIALPATQGAARLDASEAIDRAVGLYFRWHERAGRTAVQPSRVTCELIDSTIYIRSGDRDLARYRVSGDGKMRRIWPKAAT
ncbi:hypothetical protein Sinac_7616 (plasmid) [Singulisphaera acidiphila DSM 18658]|uniref:Uncharacterized protein n=2 Tax=Singulisphaera acidiphila TaxID=466153 RepID=L0DRN8_SINAD|nr:hypothetical protein Sinac_7616 [Singulisphaera acidiphila DSM 18658]